MKYITVERHHSTAAPEVTNEYGKHVSIVQIRWSECVAGFFPESIVGKVTVRFEFAGWGRFRDLLLPFPLDDRVPRTDYVIIHYQTRNAEKHRLYVEYRTTNQSTSSDTDGPWSQ